MEHYAIKITGRLTMSYYAEMLYKNKKTYLFFNAFTLFLHWIPLNFITFSASKTDS